MIVKKIGEVLVEQGMITTEQLQFALDEQTRRGGRFGDLVIALGFVTEVQLSHALGLQVGVDPVDLDTLQLDPAAIALLPKDVAWRHRVVPLHVDEKEGTITVALEDARNTLALDEVELATKHFVRPLLARDVHVGRFLERCYGPGGNTEPQAPRRKKRVGEILVEAKVVDENQLAIALAEQKRVGGHLGQILVNLGLASEEAVSRALASQSGIEHMSLDGLEPDPRAVAMVGEAFARKHQLAPLAVDMDTGLLSVAMVNPADIVAIDELEMSTNLFVRAAKGSERQIARFIDRAYRRKAAASTDSSLEALIREAGRELHHEVATTGRGSVAALVDQLVSNAIRKEATDLHFEPAHNVIRVRMRIDGDLVQGLTLSAELLPSIVARIKVLAELDIALTRVPQDGKIQFAFENRKVDLRVSTFPTLSGESVVIRVLDKSKAQLNLEGLGLPAREEGILRRAAQRPTGLALAVGPTGSGKTTTLYALLRTVNSSTRKVITLEDPVEYEMSLVTQCQINEKAGVTFANGLRAILRHDPDIILVGEMRDVETARMALRAALTGHLVLSTLHANDAVRTLSRLRDMGLESYLIASCLAAVCAQRLVRLVCDSCRKVYKPSPAELDLLGLAPDEPGSFVRGEGCERCSGMGTRGRRALYEVLEVTPEISQSIARDVPVDGLIEIALQAGMVPFRTGAQRLAREGVISLEEAARVSVES